jgi:predicted lipase
MSWIEEEFVAIDIGDCRLNKRAMKGKERLTNTKEGIWLHSTIAVTPERLALGSLEANFWERKLERANKNRTAKEDPIFFYADIPNR